MPGDTGTGISREDYLDKVVSDVVSKLPHEMDLKKIRKALGLEIAPTTIVLLQELERFNKLISRMHTSLLTLRKVGPTYTYHFDCVSDSLRGSRPPPWPSG